MTAIQRDILRLLPLLSLAPLLACHVSGFRREYAAHLAPPAGGEEAGIWVAWLGNAGLYVSEGAAAVLIDPFVTRPSLARVGLGRGIAPDEGLVDRLIARLRMHDVRYVLVTHSHYDHVLDAPLFARKLGAALVGSPDVLNVGRGQGLPESSLIEASRELRLEAGGLRLRTLPSRHSQAVLGRLPYPGRIESPLGVPAAAASFRVGAVFSILVETDLGSFVSHASAAVEPGMFDGVRADTVFLAIAGRSSTAGYLQQVVVPLGASRIIPIHFDDFFSPLGEQPSKLPFVHMGEFVATTNRLLPGVRIETLPVGVSVPLFGGGAR